MRNTEDTEARPTARSAKIGNERSSVPECSRDGATPLCVLGDSLAFSVLKIMRCRPHGPIRGQEKNAGSRTGQRFSTKEPVSGRASPVRSVPA